MDGAISDPPLIAQKVFNEGKGKEEGERKESNGRMRGRVIDRIGSEVIQLLLLLYYISFSPRGERVRERGSPNLSALRSYLTCVGTTLGCKFLREFLS